MAKRFFDTNILVYAFADHPKAALAGSLLLEGGDISVQVLNEFTNVARRKMGFDWASIETAIADILVLARAVHPLDMEVHHSARTIAGRYGLGFYDSLIVAAALQARCDILYSEDMQDGMEIDGKIVIRNPFLALAAPLF
jgi:predicted nucleic acid-binding protein